MRPDDFGETREEWKAWIRAKGLHCIRCKDTPLYEERAIFLDKMMCGWCSHFSQKNGPRRRGAHHGPSSRPNRERSILCLMKAAGRRVFSRA